jgi:hypothetical protein
MRYLIEIMQIPLAVPSKEWFCGRSLADIAGSNPAGRHGCRPDALDLYYTPVQTTLAMRNCIFWESVPFPVKHFTDLSNVNNVELLAYVCVTGTFVHFSGGRRLACRGALILLEVNIKSSILWDVSPCGCVDWC